MSAITVLPTIQNAEPQYCVDRSRLARSGLAENTSRQHSIALPLPDRKHFKQVLVPSVKRPLFITKVSRELMLSCDFFCTHQDPGLAFHWQGSQ